ncbi:nodal homolog [Narcine bancroftii]|uniref:nodal homolog n=1 Tax=Narcine bancroftii TaxID=1343680 RepID=UPI003831170F
MHFFAFLPVLISAVMGKPAPRLALETPHGLPPTRREVAAFVRRLEARNGVGPNLPSPMISLYRSYFHRESPAMPQADTVRSLVAKSFRPNGSRWIVTFDMSTLAANEKVQFAELRISLPPFAESCSLLEIHHQSQYPCGSTTCRDQLFLGSFHPDSVLEDTADCAVYNVTSLMRHWSTRNSSGGYGELQRSEGMVCRSPRSLPDAKGKWKAREMALLLVFSQRPEQSCLESSPLLRDAEGSRRVRKPLSRKGCRRKPGRDRRRGGAGLSRSPRSRGHTRRHSKRSNSNLCRRIKFEIKFAKIGWGAWVIFPKVYNAFRCEGECPIPTGDHVKPSNHAYMQSLLKFHHPTLVPSPCCVPTKMNPMSMLYTEKGEVVLRHHENMVVRECGCR